MIGQNSLYKYGLNEAIHMQLFNETIIVTYVSTVKTALFQVLTMSYS